MGEINKWEGFGFRPLRFGGKGAMLWRLPWKLSLRFPEKAGEPFTQNSGRALHHDPPVGWAGWLGCCLETPKAVFEDVRG